MTTLLLCAGGFLTVLFLAFPGSRNRMFEAAADKAETVLARFKIY